MTMTCPTPCDPDCEAECHEYHQVAWRRTHIPLSCRAPAKKPGWVSNVASGDLSFDELAQAIYEAYRVHLEGQNAPAPPVVPWHALPADAHWAWNVAARTAHRKIVRKDQDGGPHAQ